MVRKKKLTAGMPGSHANKGLTEHQVRVIRHLREDGKTLAVIAKRFDVDPSLISRICNGLSHGPLEAR